MLRIVAALAAVAVGASFAYAQNLDIIKQRRETMRVIAGASSPNFKMMKGDVPFDLAAVQANLKTIEEQAAKFKTQFPDDSKTGGGTDVSPTIWTARAEFDGTIDKWIAAAKTAAAAIKDEATFKANYPAFSAGCGGCHKATEGFTIALGESFKKPKP